MAIRTSEAEWQGDLKTGKGEVKLGSGAYEGAYSYQSRFEDGTGTNPEELIAAAHAGCFSMALAAALAGAGHTATKIHTSAKVHFGPVPGGFAITRIELTTEGSVPGIDAATFEKTAAGAKENCPVSKALKAVEISLTARLV
jgi:osmotically inducible protein OsmC